MSDGRPLQIIRSVGDEFELNENDLDKILEHEDLKDRSVVVISVAGAFRKGKSFLLDFFIRYLNAVYVKRDAKNWLGPQNQPLQGFSWTNGPERDTTGILMWSEIFLHEAQGQKIAIILLDTQGVFDNKTTSKNCAVIFGLSTLLSSVQIYNLSGNIQENDLQYLQVFTEYGKLALEESDDKPFQELVFLIRDWSYPQCYEFGPVGGNRMITKYLQTSEDQKGDLKSVRKYLAECFDKIECFLMPHPGINILKNQHFDGRLEDISEEFLKSIDILVQMVLTPKRLVVKKVNGEKVTLKELVQYFRTYLKILTEDDLPEPKNILEATAEVNHLNIFSECKTLYLREMGNLCGKSESFSPEDFLKHHETIKARLVAKFDAKKKMGSSQMSSKYRAQLIQYLDQIFQLYSRSNNTRNELSLVVLECSHLTVISDVKDFYVHEMEKVFRNHSCIDSEELRKMHEDIKTRSIAVFKNKCEQNRIKIDRYMEEVHDELEDLFSVYKSRNESNIVILGDRAHEDNARTFQNAIDSYSEEMESILNNPEIISCDSLELNHIKIKKKITDEMSLDIIGESNVKQYQAKLDIFLEYLYNVFMKRFTDKLKIFQLATEANNLKVMGESRTIYINCMNTALAEANNISEEGLQVEHLRNKIEALEYFKTSKIEGDQSFERYLEKLGESIDEIHVIFQQKIENPTSSWMTVFQEVIQIAVDFTPYISAAIRELKYFFDFFRRR